MSHAKYYQYTQNCGQSFSTKFSPIYDSPFLRAPTVLFDISDHVEAHEYSQLQDLSLLQLADVKGMCRQQHHNKLVLEQAYSQQLKHLTPKIAGSPSTGSKLYLATIPYHILLASLSY
jgi:hypothetical protein